MKSWLENLSSAWLGIFSHKLRSLLTILGIVIGVAAVIALMSIGKGVEAHIIWEMERLGTNLLFIKPEFFTPEDKGEKITLRAPASLTVEDAQAIAQQVPYLTAVAPVSVSTTQVIAGAKDTYAQLTGITPEYLRVLNLQIAQGSFFSDYDLRSAARVAVLGSNISQTLFGNDDPIGQMVRLGKTPVRVIGVLQSKGITPMGLIDESILIPLPTIQQVATWKRTSAGQTIVSEIIVQVADRQHIPDAVEQIGDLLRHRHNVDIGEENFTIASQEDLIRTISQTIMVFTFFLGSIAAISLLVGGIGVMNIMLVSVVERTREIGIRKALGAQQKDIIIQFITEAVLLTLIGGAIGIILGWGLSLLLSFLADIQTTVSPSIVLLAFSVSASIGLFFGFYPAWRASRLNPIEALRHE